MSEDYIARWGQTLVWGLIILLIGLVGAVLIVLISRRIRSYMFPSPRKPTKYVDAWKLYRLPSEPGLGDADMAPDEDFGDGGPEPRPPAE